MMDMIKKMFEKQKAEHKGMLVASHKQVECRMSKIISVGKNAPYKGRLTKSQGTTGQCFGVSAIG